MGLSVRIVGCGRSFMGDDQAGLLVARKLQQSTSLRADVFCDEAPGDRLAGELDENVELLVIVDAALADGNHPAGSSERIDYRTGADALTERLHGSTHTLGVVEGLKLAEVLGVLPRHVWIYVIFGTDFERRPHVSPTVGSEIVPLARRIESDVDHWLASRAGPPGTDLADGPAEPNPITQPGGTKPIAFRRP